MLDIEKIEESCVQAAEDSGKSLETATGLLAVLRENELVKIQKKKAQTLRDAVELVCDSVESVEPQALDFFMTAARIGLDSPLLRDRLADCARSAFSTYLDPAGMLFAVGIHNEGAPAFEIPVKWAVFAKLREGIDCVHPLHGCGRVKEVDDLGNEVYVEITGRSQSFPLSVFLDSFHLILPESPIASLINGNNSWKALAQNGLGSVRTAFAESLLPASDGLDVIKATLVPNVLSPEGFVKFTDAAVDVSGLDEVVRNASDYSSSTDGPEAGENTAVQEGARPITAARSLEELAILLEEGRSGEFDEQAIENCRNLLLAGAIKRNAVKDFGHCVILLWNLTEGAEWMVNILKEVGDTALVWADPDVFGGFINSLKVVQAELWLKATFAALPREQAVNLVLGLPLKNLNLAQRVMSALDGDDSALADGVLERMRGGNVNADLIVWLWNSRKTECEEIRDPLLVMRTLGHDVSGPYLKANRDLKKMVIGNEKFQTFLMGDGDSTMVRRMVGAVRQYTDVLDSGERQSLLVRLARLYPEVREAIETRTRNQRESRGGVRKQSKITSYLSYVRRQRELQEIINVKIPENSRAIAHARSYGDLRENAEYKAAKEEQSHLTRRRGEIEKELNEVQPTDFADVASPTVVVPGSTVVLQTGDGGDKVHHIVGLWDGDPARSMLSYSTPLGKELLGKKIGDSIQTPGGDDATVKQITELPEDMRQELADSDNA
jgi:transcription elongation GreA/GreB family factor